MDVVKEANSLAKRHESERIALLNRLEAEERRLLSEASKLTASIAAIRGASGATDKASSEANQTGHVSDATARGAVQKLAVKALASCANGLRVTEVYAIVLAQRPDTGYGATETALKRLCRTGIAKRHKDGHGVARRWVYKLTTSDAPTRKQSKQIATKPRMTIGPMQRICINVLNASPDGLRTGHILTAVKKCRPEATTSVVCEALRALHDRGFIDRAGVRYIDDPSGGGYIYKQKTSPVVDQA